MESASILQEKADSAHRLVQRALVAENIAKALEDSLAPLGTYKLPGMLDRRRLEFGIPNGCFEHFPLFDKVYIWQLNMTERKTYSKGGAIIKPEQRVAHDRATAARGIIVSAGLAALDSLRSTGVDLGHIVRFKKFSPFIQVVEEISGVELTVMTMRDGDCVSSEDLARDFHEGRVRVVNVSKEKGGYDHRFERTLDDGTLETTGAKVAAYYDPSV